VIEILDVVPQQNKILSDSTKFFSTMVIDCDILSGKMRCAFRMDIINDDIKYCMSLSDGDAGGEEE
jgi:hypothetical protein